MDTYLGMEDRVLATLKAQQAAVDAWSRRTGVDLAPCVRTIRDTAARQRAAKLKVLFPDQSLPAFGDGAEGRGKPLEPLQDFLANGLPDEGVYLMRSGWEKT